MEGGGGKLGLCKLENDLRLLQGVRREHSAVELVEIGQITILFEGGLAEFNERGGLRIAGQTDSDRPVQTLAGGCRAAAGATAAGTRTAAAATTGWSFRRILVRRWCGRSELSESQQTGGKDEMAEWDHRWVEAEDYLLEVRRYKLFGNFEWLRREAGGEDTTGF